MRVKYDKPKKIRHKDSLIREGALFFRKENKKWCLVGEVRAVHHHVNDSTFVNLDILKYHDEYLIKFRTKSDTAIHFGYERLGHWERTHGVIDLRINENYWIA